MIFKRSNWFCLLCSGPNFSSSKRSFFRIPSEAFRQTLENASQGEVAEKHIYACSDTPEWCRNSRKTSAFALGWGMWSSAVVWLNAWSYKFRCRMPPLSRLRSGQSNVAMLPFPKEYHAFDLQGHFHLHGMHVRVAL